MENRYKIAEFIWGIKELIRNEYDAKDYEEVILLFTLLRRIYCVLETSHEKVVQKLIFQEGAHRPFGAGIPNVSDGSLLFLQHMISKMEPKGSTIGIVFNGSPLFNGDADGGWSNIRGWMMDDPNDPLYYIVAMPKDPFYGTGIGSYVWILNNRKAPNHKCKVLSIYGYIKHSQRRKSFGKETIRNQQDFRCGRFQIFQVNRRADGSPFIKF